MGKAKRNRSVRRQIDMIATETAHSEAPKIPRVKWYHKIPIFGTMAYRKKHREYVSALVMFSATLVAASKKTYRGSKK